MDLLIIETSLEALIQRATDPRNVYVDSAAVEAIIGLIWKNPESSYIASKMLAKRIQSDIEWEALQALSLLDRCLCKCGPAFQTEIGKFRFLNEMIKIVSPKFLGAKTPATVRNEVLGLLYSWTISYPQEQKIREAFDMLKKQGVVPQPKLEVPKTTTTTTKKPNILDDEFGQKLQKLLTSKNAQDLDAANRLIKIRVLETERRANELERIKTNVRLLAEMLDSCNPLSASQEDLQLMGEVYAECERLRPTIFKIAAETVDPDMLAHVVSVNEEISQVFEKYTAVVIKREIPPDTGTINNVSTPSSLLDLNSPVEDEPKTLSDSILKPSQDLLGDTLSSLDLSEASSSQSTVQSTALDQLGAIFGSLATPSASTVHSAPPVVSQLPEKSNKQKALDELDVLGETMLQQYKNDMSHSKEAELAKSDVTTDDEMMDLTEPIISDSLLSANQNSGDTTLLGTGPSLPDEPLLTVQNSVITEQNGESILPVKSLSDVVVSLDSIKPSDAPSILLLESSIGVKMMIHLAMDVPRPDVSVYVLTTTSTSKFPLQDYLFQIKVPKGCKFKLLPSSGTCLPSHNPFLPPAAITQILLLANPNALSIHITFMLSFTMDDETMTEAGELSDLPTNQTCPNGNR